ncbi:MAG: hypothetical protein A2287_07535 [Candidatus Melainabacteria bacterium RIFOXYA12_FULL_32_12]|nr:MAG: hypothetical protein A2287_07535 [Candidatus Melainabacteria bacterium RIFOXYA12_FULL_32_12]
MKRGLSFLLALQILFLITPASKADNLCLNDCILENETIKISCKDEFGNEIPYLKDSGLSGGQITGIAAAGTGLFTLGSIYWKKKHDYTRKYDLIGYLESGKSMNNTEFENYISKSTERLKLLPVIAKKLDYQDSDNVKPVALLNTNNNKKIINRKNEWFYLFEDSQIQDKSLHMYSLKLPPDLANSSEKITVNTILITDMPVNTKLNNDNIDFHIFEKSSANKIAKTFVAEKFNHSGEFKEKLNIKNLELSIDNRKQVFIQKEFKLNKVNSQEPIILAVSNLNKSKKPEQNLNQQNYAVIVKVKKS